MRAVSPTARRPERYRAVLTNAAEPYDRGQRARTGWRWSGKTAIREPAAAGIEKVGVGVPYPPACLAGERLCGVDRRSVACAELAVAAGIGDHAVGGADTGAEDVAAIGNGELHEVG